MGMYEGNCAQEPASEARHAETGPCPRLAGWAASRGQGLEQALAVGGETSRLAAAGWEGRPGPVVTSGSHLADHGIQGPHSCAPPLMLLQVPRTQASQDGRLQGSCRRLQQLPAGQAEAPG